MNEKIQNDEQTQEQIDLWKKEIENKSIAQNIHNIVDAIINCFDPPMKIQTIAIVAQYEEFQENLGHWDHPIDGMNLTLLYGPSGAQYFAKPATQK